MKAKQATRFYAASNLECACIIASNPVAYPLGGLMQEWADVVLSRAVQPQDAEAGPLFAAAGQRQAA